MRDTSSVSSTTSDCLQIHTGIIFNPNCVLHLADEEKFWRTENLINLNLMNKNKLSTMIPSRIMVLICLIVGSRLSAQLVDNLDTTANFDAGFNGTSATANGDGTVILSRTQSGVDAGIDWMQGGTSLLSLASENLLVITPASSGSINGGMYNVNILFWTSTDVFVTEVNWLSDSTSTSPQTLDVSQFAIDNDVSPTAAIQNSG